MDAATERQRAYYDRTASDYDSLHVKAGDEHSIALEYMAGLIGVLGAQTVLDVGAGTGRAVRYLLRRRPEISVAGIEPVTALRLQAEAHGTRLEAGTGEAIAAADGAFDVVIATGVLHHVPRPERVVREMTRVAKKAVMISDSNRFGQGSPAVRSAKLFLDRVGLWPLADRVRTRGKGYMESDSDGIFYSYSIFDSFNQVAAWADRTFVIPTDDPGHGRLGHLVHSGHGLLIGAREPRAAWVAEQRADDAIA